MKTILTISIDKPKDGYLAYLQSFYHSLFKRIVVTGHSYIEGESTVYNPDGSVTREKTVTKMLHYRYVDSRGNIIGIPGKAAEALIVQVLPDGAEIME